MSGESVQRIANKVFDDTTSTINTTSVGAASAYAGPSDKSLEAIWNAVFDPATNTLRIVEV